MRRIILLLTRSHVPPWWRLDWRDGDEEKQMLFTLPVLLEVLARKLKGTSDEAKQEQVDP